MHIRQSDMRKLYLLQHPVLVAMACSAVLGGTFSLMDNAALRESSVGLTLPIAFALVWATVYASGGALTLVGILLLDARVEAFGLCLAASAWATYSICIFSARGFGPGVLAASIFLGICAGSWARAYLIATGRSMEPWRRRS